MIDKPSIIVTKDMVALAKKAWGDAVDSGDGYAVGDPESTCEEAAAIAGMTVAHTYCDGSVICDNGTVIRNSNNAGPWAVDCF